MGGRSAIGKGPRTLDTYVPLAGYHSNKEMGAIIGWGGGPKKVTQRDGSAIEVPYNVYPRYKTLTIADLTRPGHEVSLMEARDFRETYLAHHRGFLAGENHNLSATGRWRLMNLSVLLLEQQQREKGVSQRDIELDILHRRLGIGRHAGEHALPLLGDAGSAAQGGARLAVKQLQERHPPFPSHVGLRNFESFNRALGGIFDITGKAQKPIAPKDLHLLSASRPLLLEWRDFLRRKAAQEPDDATAQRQATGMAHVCALLDSPADHDEASE